MDLHACKPGEYFRRPVVTVVAQLSEKNSEQLEERTVDISRKDLDDHEPVVDESTRESRSTRKDV